MSGEENPIDSLKTLDYHIWNLKMKNWCERMIKDHQDFLLMIEKHKNKPK